MPKNYVFLYYSESEKSTTLGKLTLGKANVRDADTLENSSKISWKNQIISSSIIFGHNLGHLGHCAGQEERAVPSLPSFPLVFPFLPKLEELRSTTVCVFSSKFSYRNFACLHFETPLNNCEIPRFWQQKIQDFFEKNSASVIYQNLFGKSLLIYFVKNFFFVKGLLTVKGFEVKPNT